jgi:hypothetical protein
MWGDWHVGVFLDANLPTMLASGNLPALAAKVEFEYLIYTTPEDARRMKQHPAFLRLKTLANVRLELFRPETTSNPIGLHHEVWGKAIRRARELSSFILLMPPDVLWANGSFGKLGDALSAGKRAIFMTYPRVVSETLLPAMLDRFVRSADQSIAVPATEMMSLALVHIHPLMAAYMRSGSHFPVHPEMVIWPVEGDGFLLRLMARELFCFEPGRYELNSQSLLARLPPEEEVHVFDDSREFLGLSLTPLWKDMEWYLRPRRVEPLFVGRWWITYDSPFNDYLSNKNLRFWTGKVDEVRWRRLERQADALLTHFRLAREFVRVLLALREAACLRAAAFLAAALRVYGVQRRWVHRGPLLILAPKDAAFDLGEELRFPGHDSSRSDVLLVMKAHVAPLPAGGALEHCNEVTTLAGQRVRLTNTAEAKVCGENMILPIETLLHVPIQTGKEQRALAHEKSEPTGDHHEISG